MAGEDEAGTALLLLLLLQLVEQYLQESPYFKELRPHHLTAVDLAAPTFPTLLIVSEVGVPLAGHFCSVVMGVTFLETRPTVYSSHLSSDTVSP